MSDTEHNKHFPNLPIQPFEPSTGQTDTRDPVDALDGQLWDTMREMSAIFSAETGSTIHTPRPWADLSEVEHKAWSVMISDATATMHVIQQAMESRK